MSMYDLVKKESQVTGKTEIRKAKYWQQTKRAKLYSNQHGPVRVGFVNLLFDGYRAVWMKTLVLD